MNTLLNKLNQKKSGKKGFTLMEMLIVVAIIAILIAIAIPTFTNALNKARQATDEANLRAFYSERITAYMLENEALPTSNTDTVTVNGTDHQLNDDKIVVAGVDYTLQAGTYTITTTNAGTGTAGDPTYNDSFVITYTSNRGPSVQLQIPGGDVTP